MKIAVFMGGTSSEKEISLKSGEAVLESLKKQGYGTYGVILNFLILLPHFLKKFL